MLLFSDWVVFEHLLYQRERELFNICFSFGVCFLKEVSQEAGNSCACGNQRVNKTVATQVRSHQCRCSDMTAPWAGKPWFPNSRARVSGSVDERAYGTASNGSRICRRVASAALGLITTMITTISGIYGIFFTQGVLDVLIIFPPLQISSSGKKNRCLYFSLPLPFL